ncbi:hypothetical protein J4032_29240 [Streptomyces formicae]|uniref:Uncharacterized protein n=1 Tax=Streptomyces formicae TaxID=1616117 RepID=A0ABY3WZ10_9ACTN|nr:hypothetical protein [Streptomyces formicae]UNM15008.1 hypothetical protein J4032_29240 [Streptomyces formicae]
MSGELKELTEDSVESARASAWIPLIEDEAALRNIAYHRVVPILNVVFLYLSILCLP